MNKATTYTVQQAIKKMESYCTYQERCHKDVRTKLKEMNMIPLAVNTIISHLINNDYLNEERFAKSFVSGKFTIKKWGKERITRELKARNVSEYNIKAALSTIAEEAYNKTFNELLEKRLSQLEETTLLKKKKKLADYLLYRGWEPEMVYGKIHEIME